MATDNKEELLEIISKRIENDKRHLEELMLHPAVKDESHPQHQAYIGYINTTNGSIKASQELYSTITNTVSPAQEEVVEELEEIEYSVRNTESEYHTAENELNKQEELAQKALNENDTDVVFALRGEIMQAFAEQQETNFFLAKQHVEDEKQIAELQATIAEIKQQMEQEKMYSSHLSKAIYEQSLSDEAQAKSYLSMKPFSYAHYQLKQTLQDVRESVSDVKDSVAITKAVYKTAMRHSLEITKTKVTDTLSPMVTAAGHTAVKVAHGAADLYNRTMCKAQEVFSHAKHVISQGLNKLNQTKDIILDTVTFGVYSEMRKRVAERKNVNLQKEQIYIDNNVAYWDNIKKANPIWGEKAADNTFTKVLNGQSPVAALLNKVDEGTKAAGEAFCNAVTATKDKVREIKTNAIQTVDNTRNTILGNAKLAQVKSLEIKASVITGIASLYGHSERRIQSRIKQLHQADHEIFEANNQMRKVLHNMVEITPYKQKPYECSPEVNELTKQLRAVLDVNVEEAALMLAKQTLTNETAIVEQFKDSTNPACQAAYKIANRIIEKETAKIERQMLKEQRKAERALDKIDIAELKAEEAHNLAEAKKALAADKAIDNQFNEWIDAYNVLMDNKDELANNQAKIAEAKDKLQSISETKNCYLEKAQKLRNEAMQHRTEANELLNNRDDV